MAREYLYKLLFPRIYYPYYSLCFGWAYVKILCRVIYYCFTGKALLPTAALVDPANMCDLRCPLCPTGAKKLDDKQSVMSLATFNNILQKMPSVKQISLCNWGEPFLNPNICEIIHLAKARNIRVTIDTSLCIEKDREFFKGFIKSGLDYLVISIDGACQQTYAKYRIGGNFDLVVSNIKTLVSLKKEIGTKNPVITWKLLVNKYNEGEIEKAKEAAYKLGVRFKTATLHLADYSPDLTLDESVERRMALWLPKNKRYLKKYYRNGHNKPFYKHICPALFTELTINPEGKVYPCCHVVSKKNIFGDLACESLEKIWNNKFYKASRDLFVPGNTSGIETICAKCTMFKQR